MPSRNLHLPMAPAGLIVDRHEVGPDGLIVHAHGGGTSGTCPGCGMLSGSVHSRYVRSPRDFPAYGRGLIIRLTARRFRCSVSSCDRRTFVEQFASVVIAARARRTIRLDYLVHCIGVVLGGRPGERLTERLSMPVSADTLLRTLRRRSAPTRRPRRSSASMTLLGGVAIATERSSAISNSAESSTCWPIARSGQ